MEPKTHGSVGLSDLGEKEMIEKVKFCFKYPDLYGKISKTSLYGMRPKPVWLIEKRTPEEIGQEIERIRRAINEAHKIMFFLETFPEVEPIGAPTKGDGKWFQWVSLGSHGCMEWG